MQNQERVFIPLTEKIRGVAGIFGIRTGEEPEYMLKESDGNKEVRAYLPYTVAQIEILGDEPHATEEAFKELADYLFGNNFSHTQMTMTTPILKERSGQTSMMCVILPSKFLEFTAPKPENKNIKFESRPREIVASIEYSGMNSPEKMAAKEQELIDWLSSDTPYLPGSEVRIALYDPPLTIPFMRKNELHISVKKVDYKNRGYA